MLRKIITFIVLMFCIIQFSFAASLYRNEAKIEHYKNYIEQKAGDFIREKTLGEKMDLLLKVQKVLLAYESKTSVEGKQNFVSLLYALEEYIEESISGKINIKLESITITVIDDLRCSDCETGFMLDQLKNLSFLDDAQYIYRDFSEHGVSEYLEKNGIQKLPAIIFNTNNFDDGGQISSYLQILPDDTYSLAIGASFDPYEQRSSRGFKILDLGVLEDIKSNSYISGNENAEISWIEYSDLECPFCARLHNNGTVKKIEENFGSKLNIIFQHFPLSFHDEALLAAQAIECVGEQNKELYYSIIDASYNKYSNNNFSLIGFYNLAEENAIDKTELETCVDSEKYEARALSQMSIGQSVFGITGTPGSVIINNITGEYEIIGGAYPYDTFKETIEKLLR